MATIKIKQHIKKYIPKEPRCAVCGKEKSLHLKDGACIAQFKTWQEMLEYEKRENK